MVRTLEVYRPPTAPRKAPSSTPAPSGGSKTAAFSPEDFVYQCWFLEVDCSAKAKQEFFSNGADNEYVKMPYLSASGDHGGNAGAMTFKQAVEKVLLEAGLGKGAAFFGASDFDYMKLFTGQPKLEHMAKLMGLVLDRADDFKKIKIVGGKGSTDFAKYYADNPPAPLPRLREDKCYGMDCIGFLSRYLEAARVMSYPARLPREFLDLFEPVTDISQVEDLCIGVRCDGSHVNIIDRITARTDKTISAIICQSASGGPQRNDVVFKTDSSNADGDDSKEQEALNAALAKNPGDSTTKRPGILDIDGYNRQMRDWEAEKKAEADAQGKRKDQLKDYYKDQQAAALQAKTDNRMMNATRGYKNGLIFMLSGGGTTGVTGLFYLARLPGGIKKLY